MVVFYRCFVWCVYASFAEVSSWRPPPLSCVLPIWSSLENRVIKSNFLKYKNTWLLDNDDHIPHHDHGRTRTCSLRIRSPTPYPLGHTIICLNTLIRKSERIYTWNRNWSFPTHDLHDFRKSTVCPKQKSCAIFVKSWPSLCENWKLRTLNRKPRRFRKFGPRGTCAVSEASPGTWLARNRCVRDLNAKF